MDVLRQAEVRQQTVLVFALQVVRVDVAADAVVRDGVLRLAELDHCRRVELLLAAGRRPALLLVLGVGRLLNQECPVLAHVSECIQTLRRRRLGKPGNALEGVLLVLIPGDAFALAVRTHEVLSDAHSSVVDAP